MLTALYRKLIALLAAAGLTAYAEDCVPAGAAFPFVTCRIETPVSLHEQGSIVLTCWLRSDAAHSERLLMADALMSLVPTGGVLLPLTNGVAALFRAEEHAVTWPQSEGALGVCIRHGLRMVGTDT